MLIDQIIASKDFQAALFIFSNPFVIKCDDAAHMINNKKLSTEDFPCVSPPFTQIWFEFHIAHKKYGVFLRSLKKDLNNTYIFDPKTKDVRTSNFSWECTASYFSEDIKDLGNRIWIVDHMGKFISYGISNLNKNIDPHTFTIMDFVVFQTLSLMHCKNVELKESDPWDEALQRSRIKKGKKPLVRFHTLVIDGFKKAVKDTTGSEPLTRHALHICRGHFRTYEEKPLFGKVRGTFWVPMHTKGSAAEGIVKKDYEIKI